jgi:hypothetical protein
MTQQGNQFGQQAENPISIRQQTFRQYPFRGLNEDSWMAEYYWAYSLFSNFKVIRSEKL